MKRKGFTLVELLVVIAIIALLMGLLMPALARVKQVAYRMVCGTNLAGIGKAILIYANDNDEEYPYGGGRQGHWTDLACIQDWKAATEGAAFGGDGSATMTSNFYLLLRNTDVTPKQFVCKGDVGCRVFKLSEGYEAAPVGYALEDCWDFGSGGTGDTFLPSEYCSYAYHMPYMNAEGRKFPVSVVSDPGCPVSADRNPYLDRNADAYIDDGDLENPIMADMGDGVFEYTDPDKKGNSALHQREGQNVLFNDSHVNFEKYPNVGIENDNIWKYWPSTPPPALEDVEIQVGSEDNIRLYAPADNGDHTGPKDYKDAYLVNHDNHR